MKMRFIRGVRNTFLTAVVLSGITVVWWQGWIPELINWLNDLLLGFTQKGHL